MLTESPAVLTRKEWALIEYRRIITANYDRQMAALSASEHSKQAPDAAMNSGPDIRGRSIELAVLMGSRFDCRKSSLMNRLLEGKAALDTPPPTSFSYPWYAIVETPGTYPVTLGPVITPGISTSQLKISINQCNWSVRGFNQAAQTLLDLEASLHATQASDRGTVRHDWTTQMQEQVKAAYQQGPEFIVQHGAWSEFRLFVGLNGNENGGATVFRRYAESRIECSDWANVCSVFDLDGLCINGRIGKTLGKGDRAQKRLQEARIQFALSVRQGRNSEAQTKILDDLEEDVKRYEADPQSGDLVELIRDQWRLEKIDA